MPQALIRENSDHCADATFIEDLIDATGTHVPSCSAYLNLLGLPVRTWSRRRPASGSTDAFAECRTVLVLIRDAEIVPFRNECLCFQTVCAAVVRAYEGR